MADYKVYKSDLVINNQEKLIEDIECAHAYFKRNFGKIDSTWGYAFYNIFSITSPSLIFYQLFQELKMHVRRHIGTPNPLWIQSWANYHYPHEVLDWHGHAWPLHGYISIRPHNTKTVFEGYEIQNEVGNIYIGPGFRKHKVEVIEPFDLPRITLGFDIHMSPANLPFEQFSLIPI
jgi:hypothetical protein